MFIEEAPSWSSCNETQLTMIACAMVAVGSGVSIVDPVTAEQYTPARGSDPPFAPGFDIELAVLHAAQRTLSTIAQDFLTGFRSEVAACSERIDG